MNFKTLNDLNNTIIKNIHKISDVDLIVGVPRSGLFVGSILSLYLNKPLTDLDSLLDGKMFEKGITKNNSKCITKIEEAKKILIVEDSSVSGNSIKKAREKLEKFKYKEKIIFLTIYVTDETKKYTDIFFEICNPPRMFEWNFMHHNGLINACVDIDGVLCLDPTDEENDDGKKYIEFIRNAKPRIIPSSTIGYLVTSRLEKYREDTEYWLNKVGIKYNNLIMMNLNSKKERQSRGNHGIYKAKIYKKLKKTEVFIESEKKQAEEINKITKKCVFCVSNQNFYKDSYFRLKTNEIKLKTKKYLSSKLKKQ